eukprot:scaffold1610_cov257-Pinguiococcus_pyrenoidosus.AAC.24
MVRVRSTELAEPVQLWERAESLAWPIPPRSSTFVSAVLAQLITPGPPRFKPNSDSETRTSNLEPRNRSAMPRVSSHIDPKHDIDPTHGTDS